MFEMMHKYRVPILVVLFVGLFGWGAWSGIQQLVEKDTEDPLIGTFRLPGETEEHKVRASEWHAVLTGIAGSFFRNIESFGKVLGVADTERDQVIWDFIVLREAARKAGVVVTDRDAGIVDEEGVRAAISDSQAQFEKDWRAVYQFKSQLGTDPGGASYGEIYERFKTEHEEVRGKAAVFARKDLSEYKLDLEKPEDLKKLEDFWEQNKWLGTRKMVPEKLDLEVAYMRFRDRSFAEVAEDYEQNWKAGAEGITVTDEEVKKRWDDWSTQYETFFDKELAKLKTDQEEENKRAKEEGREPKDLSAGDQPGKDVRAKEHVRRELLAGRLLTKVLDEVKAGKVMKDLCAQYKVACVTLEKKSLDELMEQPEFGNGRVKQHLMTGIARLKDGKLKEGEIYEYETTTKEYIPRIFDEPGAFVAVFRLIAHHPSRPNELKEIREEVIEEWRKRQGDDELRDRVKSFRDAIDAKVLEVPAVKELSEKLQKERDEAVAKEIEEAKLSRDNAEHKTRIEQVERKHDSQKELKLTEEKQKHEKDVFLALAAEQAAQGVTLNDVGWIRKSSAKYMTYAGATAPEEKLNRFLRSQVVVNGLTYLQPGRVGHPTPDPQSGLSAVLMLEEKRAPEEAEMLRRADKVQTIASQMSQQARPDDWSYKNMKSDQWFSLWAWDTEKGIAEQEKEKILREQRDIQWNRRRLEESFKKHAPAIEERRKKEAEAPPPAPPAVPAPAPDAPKPPGGAPPPDKN